MKKDGLDKAILPWESGSSRLWSLWDMLRFYAYRFISIVSLLDYLTYIIKHEGEFDLNDTKKAFIDDLDKLHKMLKKAGIVFSANGVNTIKKYVKDHPKADEELRRLVEDFWRRIKDELKGKLFFIVRPGAEKFYNTKGVIFTKAVRDKFPTMIEDIDESGNCFAFGRYTACVFHLMRIMELSVQKFGNKLGISESFTCDNEWQKILNAIRGQINSIYPKHNDPDRVKYEGVVGYLETVKIAWRNPTMHPKATYTEEEAEALMGAVKMFMKELLKVL